MRLIPPGLPLAEFKLMAFRVSSSLARCTKVTELRSTVTAHVQGGFKDTGAVAEGGYNALQPYLTIDAWQSVSASQSHAIIESWHMSALSALQISHMLSMKVGT